MILLVLLVKEIVDYLFFLGFFECGRTEQLDDGTE